MNIPQNALVQLLLRPTPFSLAPALRPGFAAILIDRPL